MTYEKILEALGMTDIQAQIEMNSNQFLDTQYLHGKFYLGASSIAGLGLFTRLPINEDDFLGFTKRLGAKTLLGRFVNHSPNPNIIFENGGAVYALRAIDQYGELTVDYEDNLRKSGRLE